jgi:hypothetical protein
MLYPKSYHRRSHPAVSRHCVAFARRSFGDAVSAPRLAIMRDFLGSGRTVVIDGCGAQWVYADADVETVTLAGPLAHRKPPRHGPRARWDYWRVKIRAAGLAACYERCLLLVGLQRRPRAMRRRDSVRVLCRMSQRAAQADRAGQRGLWEGQP